MSPVPSQHDDDAILKMVVSVKQFQFDDSDHLFSRSQAKRLLATLDSARQVVLDFQAVETIGPSFADEVFRVYENFHPDIEITYINAAPGIKRMITRAQSVGDRA